MSSTPPLASQHMASQGMEKPAFIAPLVKGLGAAALNSLYKVNINWGPAALFKWIGRGLPWTPIRRFVPASVEATRKVEGFNAAGKPLFQSGWVHDPAGLHPGDILYGLGTKMEVPSSKLTAVVENAIARLQSKGHYDMANVLRKANSNVTAAALPFAPLPVSLAANKIGTSRLRKGDVESGTAYRKFGKNIIDNYGSILGYTMPIGVLNPITASAVGGLGTAYAASRIYDPIAEIRNAVTEMVADKAREAVDPALQAVRDNRWKIAGGLAFAPNKTLDMANKLIGQKISLGALEHYAEGSTKHKQELLAYITKYGLTTELAEYLRTHPQSRNFIIQVYGRQ